MIDKKTRQAVRKWISIGVRAAIIIALIVAVISMSRAQKESEEATANPAKSPIEESEPAYGESQFLSAATAGDYELLYNPATAEIAVSCADGQIWYSNPQDRESDEISTQPGRLSSQIIMSTYVVNTMQKQTKDSTNASLNKGGMSYELIDGGICFTYAFPEQGIILPVRYMIDSEGLSVEIRASEIQELFTERYVLAGVSVLPLFGAAGLEDTGYLFVPDGSGALINYNNGMESASAYNAAVYGDDLAVSREYLTTVTENVRMPVFGAKTDDHAFLGVIEEGDASGRINATVSRKGSSYNYVYSEMTYRRSEVNDGGGELGSFSTIEFMDCFDVDSVYRVRYFFLSGEDASYSGMARRYRSWLLENSLLKTSETAGTNPFVLNLYGAVPIEQTTMGITSDRLTALTTYEEAQSLTEALRAEGIDNLVVNYRGAVSGGLDYKLTTTASAERVLGGSRAWKELLDYFDESGTRFFIDTDFYTFHADGRGYTTARDSVRSVYDSPVFQYHFGINTSLPIEESRYWLLRPTLAQELAEKFMASADEAGIENLGFAVAADTPYSDFTPDKSVTRLEAVEKIMSVLSQADARGEVLVHGGNAYALSCADVILDSPSGSSHYDVTDCEVPFYQIVTRGYVTNVLSSVNLGSNRQDAFLAALECGGSLAFTWIGEDVDVLEDTDYNDLFGADPDLWMDIARDMYAEYRTVMDDIGGDTIFSHEILAEDVTETVYSGGARIIVNRSGEAVVYDGQEIDSMSYLYIPA